MGEVFFADDAVYFPHARLTPIGGWWEGAVDIVSPQGRTMLVCQGVFENAEDAFVEAFAYASELIKDKR